MFFHTENNLYSHQTYQYFILRSAQKPPVELTLCFYCLQKVNTMNINEARINTYIRFFFNNFLYVIYKSELQGDTKLFDQIPVNGG